MIVALFPELAATGGVQRAGRLTATALMTFASQQHQTRVFLSLNDPPRATSLHVGSQEIAFTGCGRSKPLFLQRAMRAAFGQPILVIALHPYLAPVAVAMKLCAPRTRTVVFAHGIEVWTPLGLLRRKALQGSDLVFAPSTDTAVQLAKQQGVRAEKIHKLPWSLGPDFDAREPSGPAFDLPDGFPRGRVILTVGRWDASEAYKGVDHLIAAVPALLAKIPELHLVAVGAGSDVPRLQRLAVEAGVTQRVHFLPPMKPEELGAAYRACDVFALPSGGEGFGLVFLEAMSHAKPVVGGAHGGTPDVIEEGITGYLVRHGDVAQLTQRLEQLLTDEPLRRRIGAAGLERVRNAFTFDRFSRDLCAALEALLVSR